MAGEIFKKKREELGLSIKEISELLTLNSDFLVSIENDLFEKIKNNPRNVRFSDLRRLLKEENFFIERITGSHHIFRRNEYIFVIPVHNDQVKTVYVKKVIELIEDLRKLKGED